MKWVWMALVWLVVLGLMTIVPDATLIVPVMGAGMYASYLLWPK